ncbi:MAG: rod shape-determining protein MreD [Spirochaetaceae bacterium]
MIGNIAAVGAVTVALVAAQTNLLDFISIAGALPDIALIFLVYYAHHTGSFPGEIVGFLAGMTFDALSAAPLGFHAVIYTTIGYLIGISRQRVVLDPIFVPVLFVAVATLFKAFMGFLLLAIFPVDAGFTGVISPRIAVEIGYSVVLTPLLFALFSLVRPLRGARRNLTL